jgi:hypothetical protein
MIFFLNYKFVILKIFENTRKISRLYTRETKKIPDLHFGIPFVSLFTFPTERTSSPISPLLQHNNPY